MNINNPVNIEPSTLNKVFEELKFIAGRISEIMCNIKDFTIERLYEVSKALMNSAKFIKVNVKEVFYKACENLKNMGNFIKTKVQDSAEVLAKFTVGLWKKIVSAFNKICDLAIKFGKNCNEIRKRGMVVLKEVFQAIKEGTLNIANSVTEKLQINKIFSSGPARGK